MGVLRNAMAATVTLAMVPALAYAQYKPADLLTRFRPVLKGVEYDTPTDPKEVEACKVESGPEGFTVRDGQGRLLRRFIDTNGTKDAKGQTRLDQWSYYQNGFEVYREVDLNEDNSVDECRWYNSGGTRIARVEGGKVVGWRRLSAEEASKVLVQSLIGGDTETIATLMATPQELEAAGVPKAVVAKATQTAEARAAAIETLRKEGLVGWNRETVWQKFDGTLPHVIPADAGLKDDLVLYENAFVFVGQPNGQGNPMSVAYLQVPEVVKLGDTWKFVELPRAIDPKQTTITVPEGGLRAALFERSPGALAEGPEDPALAGALKALAEHDQGKAPGPEATKKDLVQYYYGRIKLLQDVLKVAKGAEDRLNYTKQIVDSLSAAYQTGLYPEAAASLDKFVEQGGEVGSYARYRKIVTEYTLESDQPGADPLKVQKQFKERLEAFVKDHGQSAEAPDVLLQLASISEFNAEEKEAREYFSRLSRDFADSEPGRKAAGALRRLDLVGKPIELSGTSYSGKPVSAADYSGKTLLITFWTTSADVNRRDQAELKAVFEKYQSQGFAVLGVNLDNDKESLAAFQQEARLPWPQVWEEGGMDSRLANEFGIFSLPTMILVDKDGKVISRNIRSAGEVEKYLEQILAEGQPRTALETKE